MKRAGIIGHPVAHSLSPVFQEAAFRQAGLNARYELWDTPLGALPVRVESLRAADVLGANVTIPHKEAVVPLVDELGGQSRYIGAVNTIVNRNGRLVGFNTDGPGFVAALRDEAAFEVAGRSILLLGAGGAARGIAFALADARAAAIGITNRTVDRAERLVAAVAAAGGQATVIRPGDPLHRFECVVNCTSIGMNGGPDPSGLPIELDALNPGALAVDIVYVPEVTPFLAAARDRGMRTLGGLPMLIYQGALAFELWTGIPAPLDAMAQAARAELQRRANPPATGTAR